MQVIRSRDRIEQVHSPSLRATMLLRAAEAEEFVDDLSELARFILIEPGEAPSDLSAELGREVHLIAPDASEVVGDHLELVYVLSDDGSCASVFVPHEVFALPRLVRGALHGRRTASVPRCRGAIQHAEWQVTGVGVDPPRPLTAHGGSMTLPNSKQAVSWEWQLPRRSGRTIDTMTYVFAPPSVQRQLAPRAWIS